MGYNFIEKLRRGEFSLREDYQQTLQDLDSLFNKTPLGWVTSKLEEKLGELQPRDAVIINGVYTFAAYIGGLAIYNQLKYGIPPEDLIKAEGCVALLGLLHHLGMGQRPQSNTNHFVQIDE